ncbi:MAG: hypothetical protein IJX17_01995 [Clostridia bacterium]|nr:hypothetical protein [Clostridia bacterium]
MTNAKSLKKALLASVMSFVVCFTMLVGTTFAWFTDSVTNNVNKIVSGNLDVELHHTKNYNDDSTIYEVVESDTELYDELVWVHGLDSQTVTAWQPNAMSTEGFKIENKGTLPLKYKFSLNFENATKTSAGKTLADILVMSVEDVNGEVSGLVGDTVLKNFVFEGTLDAGEVYEFTTNITWTQSANDNEFNVNGGLSIDLGVTLVATQLNDAAEFVETVNTVDEFTTAIANGKSVLLNNDIEIDTINLTNVNNDVFIDANGHTITTTKPYGIEISAGKNVTLLNAKIEMTCEGNYITYASGLKIANGDYSNNTVTLKECSITMANNDWAYAVNMPASVFNLNLVIDNCTLEGAIAVQCWGDNNNISITNSNLICNYNTSAYYTSYCVVLQKDGSLVSENNTLTIDNCSFVHTGTDSIGNGIISVTDLGVNNKVTVTNCVYGNSVVLPDDSWL